MREPYLFGSTQDRAHHAIIDSAKATIEGPALPSGKDSPTRCGGISCARCRFVPGQAARSRLCAIGVESSSLEWTWFLAPV